MKAYVVVLKLLDRFVFNFHTSCILAFQVRINESIIPIWAKQPDSCQKCQCCLEDGLLQGSPFQGLSWMWKLLHRNFWHENSGLRLGICFESYFFRTVSGLNSLAKCEKGCCSSSSNLLLYFLVHQEGRVWKYGPIEFPRHRTTLVNVVPKVTIGCFPVHIIAKNLKN